MPLTLHPSYFMDVESLVHLFHCNKIVLDLNDSYVKQTYRSRCYIAAANGSLTLNIPIIHSGTGSSMLYKEVLIDHSQPWPVNHLKSITSAYKNSPYYEFYEDDLKAFFKEIPEHLVEWNQKTNEWLLSQLQIEKEVRYATNYLGDDLATYLITAKKKSKLQLDPYLQVFQEKYEFQQPLSGLDLLFNLGPAARVYLKGQHIR